MTRLEIATLSLVEGRRRQAPPEIAQSTARGGRFYVLVEVSAPTELWDDASREIVQKAAQTFAASQMGETSALQAAAEAVNDYLLAKNAELPEEDHIWAGLNALFVQEKHLYLAQAGPALTYIARGDSITRFPKSFEDLQTNRLEALTPLGEAPGIQCRLAHFTLQPDDLVTLSASHLPTLADEEAVTEAIRAGEPARVIEALARLAKRQDFSALSIQYEPVTREEPPEEPAPPPERTGPRRRATPPPSPPATTGASEAASEEEDEEEAWEEEQDEEEAWEEESWEEPWEAWEEEEAAYAWEEDAWDEPPAAEGDAYVDGDGAAGERRAPERDEAPTDPPPHEEVEAVPPLSSITEPSDVTGQAEPIEPDEPRRARSRKRARNSNRGTSQTPQPKTIAGTARSINEQQADRRFDADTVGDAFRKFLAALAPLANLARTGLRHGLDFLRRVDWAGLLRRLLAILVALAVLILKVVSKLITWWQKGAAPRLKSIAPALDRVAYRVWGIFYRGWEVAKRVLLQMLPGNRPAPRTRKGTVPRPPGDGSGFLRTIAFTVPLVILLAALVTGWNVGGVTGEEPGTNESGDTTLVEEAQDLIAQAQNVDEAQAQELLAEADALLDQAEAGEPADNEAEQIALLRAQAQDLADQAETIVRPPVERIASTGEEGAPQTLIGGNGELFVLESGQAAVYRIQPSSQKPVALHPPTVALLTGEQRLPEGIIAGTPQELTWVPSGGNRSYDALLILTDEGQLFDFDPDANLLRQLTFRPVVSNLRGSSGYGGNLYLLDPEHSQIWRYVPDSDGQYSQSPQPWLTETGQEQLGNPIDIAIDGFIYLLDESGEVARFQVGERRSFALDPVDPPLSQPVAIAKAPPESTDLFVADRQRVLRFDQDGKFLVQYRAPIGSDWGALRDIMIDAENGMLYVLAENGVYRLDVSERPRPRATSTPGEPEEQEASEEQ